MEYKHTLPTLDELKATLMPVIHGRKEAQSKFSKLERFALQVTRGVGTIGFFFLLLFWSIGWLAWNLFAPANLHFDPAPAFVLWLFVSNIIQLILLPLIMVGQNLESKVDEQRAQADFDINKKAEKEIEVIIAHLENQNELILDLARKIDRS